MGGVPRRPFAVTALVLANLASSCGGAAEPPPPSVVMSAAPPVRATAEPFAPPRPTTIEEPPDPPEPAPGGPTEKAAQAYRLFETRQYDAAAIALKRVVAGETSDNAENLQFAQYRLAISLFKLELYQASYAIFAEISDRPTHRHFADSLKWLGRLASKLPLKADVVERIGKYGEKERALSNDAPHHERFMQLVFLAGSYDLRNLKYEEALALLATVDEKSQFFLPAQLASAEAFLGLRKPARAAEAFGRVETHVGSGKVTREEARLRELSRLGMGSALLSAAVQVDGAGARTVDDKGVHAAIEVLGRVDPDSEYWLDAALERATAFILTGEHARALGVLSTIQTADVPLLADYEADLRGAAVAFASCRFDDANALVAKIEKKYEPATNELTALLGRPALRGSGAADAFFGLIEPLRAGETGLSPTVRQLAQATAREGELSADLDYLRFLKEEESRFGRMPQAMRDSALGADVVDSLDLAKDIMRHQAGTLGLERFRRLLLVLTPAHTPIVDAIKAGARSNADKQAQGRLLQALWQEHVTFMARAADPSRTGRGKRPRAPKALTDPVVASNCTP